ncbi:sigma-70 family RNA polymerase sigma factor [Tessaracoccus sp. MC1679]|uniref:sigma-70 family RNA polymerase sigma factor n=1 Tax=Tessaracoccus sp. MC1679 TaxID=2760313 RepID=UPI0016003DCB|nr:sigma-70 family RNA polymerase sigma factor [Tessaracoccus sp. MC1679]MBB1516371.1 sigma-70 family RNA polymerase sigma factor [Tessaracoccus sp. MC1679]
MATVHTLATPAITERDKRAVELLRRLGAETSDTARQSLLDEVVMMHLDLCEALARRYANRGLDLDDLIQVARVGLIYAVQRFRPEAGSFVPFAVATITGEIKRHFRAGWMVRPPRRLQELRPDDASGGGNGAGVRETLALAFRPISLDAPTGTDDSAPGLQLPATDHDLELIPDLITLNSAMRRLSPVERRVLHLRFVDDLPQAEIGRRVGVSQMQVSRILSRVLGELRDEMEPAAA